MVTHEPLYSPNVGLAGFVCRITERDKYAEPCKKVTRTERGMLMHLARVHGVRLQAELFDKDTEVKHDEEHRSAQIERGR